MNIETTYILEVEDLVVGDFRSFTIFVRGIYRPEEPDGWTSPGIKPFVEIIYYEVDGREVHWLDFDRMFGLTANDYAEKKLVEARNDLVKKMEDEV